MVTEDDSAQDWVPATNCLLSVRFPPLRASLVAQMVPCLPAMQETQVRSLGQKDPLEKGMAIHIHQYSYPENSMNRGAWWATVYGVAKSQTQLSDFTFPL